MKVKHTATLTLPVFEPPRPKKPAHLNKARTIALTIIWLAAIAFGFNGLLRYESRAGAATRVAADWPAASTLSPSKTAPYTLLMFVHPRCPCSAASLAELAQIKANCPDLAVSILFLRPEGLDNKTGKARDWEKRNLWEQAAAIPGVRLVSDIDGSESKNFHALTSGQTALYNQNGKLLFAGGITDGRGHQGYSRGRAVIEKIASGGSINSTLSAWAAPVYGCTLKNDKAALSEGLKACLQ